ncbi:MAG TPA: hypothetical protein VFL77_11290 [Solirubrobacterales bacterium]|nr:hypothetical protein [Solirubrobacterales bacterium]
MIRFPAVALIVALALLGGCGSDESTTSPSAAKTAESPSSGAAAGQTERQRGAASPEPSKPVPKFGKEGSAAPHGGASEFETKGGDNSISHYGGEARQSELAEAAKVLHTYLNARAANDWRGVCAQLSTSVMASLTKAGIAPEAKSGGGPGCAAILARLFPTLSGAIAREAAEAEVGAFRVKGSRGLLLFHGLHGVPFFIAMKREGGHWKLAAPAPSELPK